MTLPGISAVRTALRWLVSLEPQPARPYTEKPREFWTEQDKRDHEEDAFRAIR